MFTYLLLPSLKCALVYLLLWVVHRSSSPALVSAFRLHAPLRQRSHEIPSRIIKLVVAVFNFGTLVLYLEPFGWVSYSAIENARLVMSTYLVFDCIEEARARFDFLVLQYRDRVDAEAHRRHGYTSAAHSDASATAPPPPPPPSPPDLAEAIRFEPLQRLVWHHAATIAFIHGVGFSGTDSVLFAMLFADLSTFCQQMFSLLLILHRNSNGTTGKSGGVALERGSSTSAWDYVPMQCGSAVGGGVCAPTTLETLQKANALVAPMQFFSSASFAMYGLRLAVFVAVALGDLVWKLEPLNPVAWVSTLLMLTFFRENVKSFTAIYDKAKVERMCLSSQTMFHC